MGISRGVGSESDRVLTEVGSYGAGRAETDESGFECDGLVGIGIGKVDEETRRGTGRGRDSPGREEICTKASASGADELMMYPLLWKVQRVHVV